LKQVIFLDDEHPHFFMNKFGLFSLFGFVFDINYMEENKSI